MGLWDLPTSAELEGAVSKKKEKHLERKEVGMTQKDS